MSQVLRLLLLSESTMSLFPIVSITDFESNRLLIPSICSLKMLKLLSILMMVSISRIPILEGSQIFLSCILIPTIVLSTSITSIRAIMVTLEFTSILRSPTSMQIIATLTITTPMVLYCIISNSKSKVVASFPRIIMDFILTTLQIPKPPK
jgi:hypothetical protein